MQCNDGVAGFAHSAICYVGITNSTFNVSALNAFACCRYKLITLTSTYVRNSVVEAVVRSITPIKVKFNVVNENCMLTIAVVVTERYANR